MQTGIVDGIELAAYICQGNCFALDLKLSDRSGRDFIPLRRSRKRHLSSLSCFPLSPRCPRPRCRSEEHTSELQSQSNLVCRLLLEKKKTVTASAHDCRSAWALVWRRALRPHDTSTQPAV